MSFYDWIHLALLLAAALAFTFYPLRIHLNSAHGGSAQLMWLPSMGISYRLGQDFRRLTLDAVGFHLPLSPLDILKLLWRNFVSKRRTDKRPPPVTTTDKKKKGRFISFILTHDPLIIVILLKGFVQAFTYVPRILGDYRLIIYICPLDPARVVGALFQREIFPHSRLQTRFIFEPESAWHFRLRFSPPVALYLALAFFILFPYRRFFQDLRSYRNHVRSL